MIKLEVSYGTAFWMLPAAVKTLPTSGKEGWFESVPVFLILLKEQESNLCDCITMSMKVCVEI